jgi:hypothetical protein
VIEVEPNERGEALTSMRKAWKQARAAGADVPTPNADDVAAMSVEDLRMWAATYHEETTRARFVEDEEAAA